MKERHIRRLCSQQSSKIYRGCGGALTHLWFVVTRLAHHPLEATRPLQHFYVWGSLHFLPQVKNKVRPTFRCTRKTLWGYFHRRRRFSVSSVSPKTAHILSIRTHMCPIVFAPAALWGPPGGPPGLPWPETASRLRLVVRGPHHVLAA